MKTYFSSSLLQSVYHNFNEIFIVLHMSQYFPCLCLLQTHTQTEQISHCFVCIGEKLWEWKPWWQSSRAGLRGTLQSHKQRCDRSQFITLFSAEMKHHSPLKRAHTAHGLEKTSWRNGSFTLVRSALIVHIFFFVEPVFGSSFLILYLQLYKALLIPLNTTHYCDAQS